MATVVLGELTEDYCSVLRNRLPTIDVRSPAEFQDGALPWAKSIPILDDDERKQVGIRYKQQGSGSAVELGHQLISGDRKEEIIQNWTEFVQHNPNAVVTCWRGGLRSQLAQNWLAEREMHIPRVAGGTKALRQFALNLFSTERNLEFVVMGGRTGVGKTRLLQEFNQAIDLEGLAHHRGSAFGSIGKEQPKPLTFEYELASELLRTANFKRVLLEDESHSIGKLGIPRPLFSQMQDSVIVVLEAPIDERVALTYEDYVIGANRNTLLSALERIQNRLGGLRYRNLRQKMEFAFDSAEPVHHYRWIEELLATYYDPMYDYQLEKKRHRVKFQANRLEVQGFLIEELGLN